MIEVASHHLKQISLHAQMVYPEECCGLLLGLINENSTRLVEVRETENSWDSPDEKLFLDLVDSTGKNISKHNRFTIAPEIILKVQKECRDRNLDIIGVYHSHPDYPAIPSEFDLAIAWSQYSYIIISLKQGKITDIRSWKLDDNNQFQGEIITNVA
ncbi:Mov34/MPN/PAD-1 family protein [Aphanothece sacrum]|uniref:Mov34/MPN/PAD-1 protein n=1 Tax=Aphanothece sacrum FPU1 TaxID=1920663 RepID=A0A401ID66_APHSA|nr:M67 family metallopeptidase [Aphanothece sacrum]GBF79215.1 Mov34/MPN/PAD-1 protein [Aphanothece sacrum FPU1]GBF86605.1 hypothetical protein AsFPU3_3677 [Aphanothece sacrum FPU3]